MAAGLLAILFRPPLTVAHSELASFSAPLTLQ